MEEKGEKNDSSRVVISHAVFHGNINDCVFTKANSDEKTGR